MSQSGKTKRPEDKPLYDSFVAEYYDYVPVVAGRSDVPFYLEEARGQSGPILELGCGTGRVLLEMAKAGHRMVGLDLAGCMLTRCREKLAALPGDAQHRVRLVQGNMTDFDLGQRFRLILIPFRPFQHLLETEQQIHCLQCVSQHLAPGGKLIVDFFQTDPRRMHDPSFLQESEGQPEVGLPDGRRLRLRERTVAFHRGEQRNDVEMLYDVTHPDGRQERHVFAFTVRYFFRYEVEHLLARTGFRVAGLYGGFDRCPLGDTSPEMIFVAEHAA